MAKKLTYEYVKNFIESTGYKLLSDTYVNSDTKLSIKCPLCGSVSMLNFRTFRGGSRCNNVSCVNERIGASKRMSFDSIRSHTVSIGLELLSDYYKNIKTKLDVKCVKYGHIYKITARGLMQSSECKTCLRKRISDDQRLTYEYVKNFIESTGYTLLSDSYNNANTKLLVMCVRGHEYYVTFGNFMSGHRCQMCVSDYSVSVGERQIQEFIESLGVSVIKNDRTQIVNPLTGYNLELDIWIPSMRKAIEYNGLYWHSLINVEKKDRIKKAQCKQLGIDLLIVDDHQWNNYKDIEMKRIEQWLLK